MCQANPLPRCSNHAAKIIEREVRKYNRMEIESKELTALADAFKEQPGESKSMRNRRLHYQDKLQVVKAKSREQLWKIWTAELQMDATKTGYRKLLENNAATQHDPRLRKATALREWQRSLRKTKDASGNPLFSQEADKALRDRILRTEYSKSVKEMTLAMKRYEEYGATMLRLKQERMKEEANPHPDARTQEEIRRIQANIDRQHGLLMTSHFDILLARGKVELLESTVPQDFREKVEKGEA